MLYTRKGDNGTTKTFGCDLPASWPDKFFVYAILCDDNSIYIGQTNNLQNRWNEHVSGNGAEYFITHKPEKLIHYEEYTSREEAVKRENNLKTGFGRKWLRREWEAGRTRQAGQRISKSSAIAEALGALDETNSFLGFARAKCVACSDSRFAMLDSRFEQILLDVQQNLFIIQAELAGAKGKTINKEKIIEIEKVIDTAEKEMPPIKSFFIPGATELGALFDVSRTLVRRAERRVVAVHDSSFAKDTANKEGSRRIGAHSLAYLNRLSSLLYALARLVNHRLGAEEKSPDYK